MMEPVSDRRPPITPQLALRVAIFGAVALALFAIVFFRLWYLQVLSGDQYLAQANSNRVRVLPIQAPRGKIVDRNGKVIVQNEFAAVIEIDPSSLPQEERDLAAAWGQAMGRRAARPDGHHGEPIKIPPIPDVDGLQPRYRRLASVLNTSATAIHRRVVRSLVLVPYSSARVRPTSRARCSPTSASAPSSSRASRSSRPTCATTRTTTLAAQILGTVGEISPKPSSRRSATAASSRARSSATTASSAPMTATCAARTASAACRSTPTAARSPTRC